MNDLASLLELRAEEAGDRPFLVMPGGVELSYGEFNERVNQVAHGLRDIGVSAGDRVMIMMRNSPEFMLGSYALKKLGAVEVAVNTEFRGAGLAHLLNLSEAELLLADEEFAEPLGAISEDLAHLRRVAFTGDSRAAGRVLSALDVGAFDELVSVRADSPGVEVSGSDLAAILFTSGTTGPSKGCMLPHRYALRAGEIIVERLGLRDDDCLFCPFPLYHVDAAFLTVAPAIVLGARAALSRRFSASRFWDEVREVGATVFDFMGATLTILHNCEPQPDDADNPVRLAWGVPMPAFRADFERRFALQLVHCYGLTDGNMVAYEDRAAEEPPGSCGRIHPAFDVRILDPADDELPRGEVGEIAIRQREPDLIMQGYYGMAAETLVAFRNLWFHTGDLGWMDLEGRLFFAGRRKDAIRRRGENISAYEIEEVVAAHPEVLECAAVGVPSELTEEEVKVVVVRRNGADLQAEELREFCRGRMARFMVPDHVQFVDAIPKTPTGKVEKYKLR